jgi:hypothetical protein
MKKIILALTSICVFFACNNPQEEKPFSSLGDISFKNTIFYFAPVFDKKNCSVYGECDCCSQDIIFGEKDFIFISYCMDDISVSKGLYSFIDNKIKMTFDTICYSSEYNWENEIEETDVKYHLKKQTIKPQTHYLSILKYNCNEFPILLDSINEHEKFFGIVLNSKKDSLLNVLKQRSIPL